MAHNDWLDFPEFDVARWEADTSTIDASERGTWDKTTLVPFGSGRGIARKSHRPKTAGNAWSLTETIHRAADVLPALMGGAEGIRLQHEAVSDEWLNEVHLNMIHLHLDADRIDLTRFSVGSLAYRWLAGELHPPRKRPHGGDYQLPCRRAESRTDPPQMDHRYVR